MRIPEIRDKLTEKSDQLLEMARQLADVTGELRHYVKELHRRPSVKTAPKSDPMTPSKARKIRAYVKAHPGMSRAAVGRVFNVNSGRVTEAMRGKRT